tara:strand:+ start:2050 stop:2346 length:297 start_codon:yes stop_codon:yes gene_type:complete
MEKVMKKYSIIALISLFALSSVVFAKGTYKKKAVKSKAKTSKKVYFTQSKKSKIQLKKTDVDLIDKAISKNFKDLSDAEKGELVKFLKDFKENASKEK